MGTYLGKKSKILIVKVFDPIRSQTCSNEHKQLDFRKMIEKLSKSLREEAMTIYEKAILEGRIEGKLEGKIEGKLEGEKAKENLFISNAIKQGFTIATIAQLTSLSEKEVKERMKELGL